MHLRYSFAESRSPRQKALPDPKFEMHVRGLAAGIREVQVVGMAPVQLEMLRILNPKIPLLAQVTT